VIQSRSFPITTDLVSIGSHTVLAKDSIVQGYKAQFNYIHIGHVVIGSNASVGEAGVVDINTVMEDDTQLGLASSLHEGQRIPKGEHFHGSPAVGTTANYCTVGTRRCSGLRRWMYTLVLLLLGLAATALFMTVVLVGAPAVWEQAVGLQVQVLSRDVDLMMHAIAALLFSLAAFLGFSGLRLLSMGVVPRLLNLFLRENRTYVLYGFHYFIEQMISLVSNSTYFNRMFGDSSAVVHYLRWVGYKLNTVVQTGSNFGMSQRHENPLMVDIGSGTMVSGGVKFVNETVSSDAFKVGTVAVGEHNYLGNYLHVPSNSVVGVNCLVATKALTPVEGPTLENIGLLGAPAFPIPRASDRDVRMSKFDEATRRRRLRAKNRYNFVTVVLFLLHNWILSLILTVGVLLAVDRYVAVGILGVYLVSGLTLLCGVVWMWLVERGVLRFGSLQPRIVPLLDPYFWFHERHWKLTSLWMVAQVFGGTPMKNLISRLQGVKMGRMVFDDGADIDEYTLVELGDYANLNTASVIQPHSLEEGVFKSGRVKLGVGCTLGSAGNVHYDVSTGDFVVIEPNSFVMKGESIECGATWIGNPAEASTNARSVVPAPEKV
jgi:non-ribosomal peptide synthetase-like protein